MDLLIRGKPPVTRRYIATCTTCGSVYGCDEQETHNQSLICLLCYSRITEFRVIHAPIEYKFHRVWSKSGFNIGGAMGKTFVEACIILLNGEKGFDINRMTLNGEQLIAKNPFQIGDDN